MADPFTYRFAAWGVLVALASVTGCGRRLGSTRPLGVEVWGRAGTGPGQFVAPRVVRVDATGNVFVVDSTGRVQRFTSGGKFVCQWQMPATERGKPEGLAPSGDSLWVADTHYHRVTKYDGCGKRLGGWGSYGSASGQFVYPTGIAVLHSGDVVVGEYGGERDRLQCFTPEGRFRWQVGRYGSKSGQFKRPGGLCVDGDGSLLVADVCNHRIQRFSAAGKFLSAFGKPGHGLGLLDYPYDVAVDGQGRIYVAEYGNHRVQVFSKEGKELGVLGRPGRKPGELCGLWSVAVDSKGFVYIADTGNNRVQKFPREVVAGRQQVELRTPSRL